MSCQDGIFNVKAYGATGNGTTDDTAQIQAAINACSGLGGGVVWIPTGTYRTSTDLWIPSDIQIVGEGRDSTIIKALASFPNSHNIFSCGPSVGNYFIATARGINIIFKDMTVDFSVVASSQGGYGISAGQVDYLRVSNVRVLQAPAYGIFIGSPASVSTTNNAINPVITYCLLDTCGASGNSDSIGGGNTTDELLLGNEFIGCYGTATDRVNPFRFTWSYNKSRNPSNATAGHLFSDCGANGGLIIGNELDHAAIHIGGYLSAAAGLNGPPAGVRIIGNRLTNAAGSAILVSASNQTNTDTRVALDCQVIGNEIESAADVAISLQDCRGCVVGDNVIDGWDSGHYAISLSTTGSSATGCNKNRVTGNILKTTTTTPLIYQEKINPSGAAKANNNVFTDNTVDTPTEPGQASLDSNLPQTLVARNQGFPPTAPGSGWTAPTFSNNVLYTNTTPYDLLILIQGGTFSGYTINGENFPTTTNPIVIVRKGSAFTIQFTVAPTFFIAAI